jgi:hypothetical protein
MALAIDHDIPVVSVLDLQDVTSHAIRRHRLDKVESSLLKGRRVDAAVLVHKVAEQVVDLGSSHLISRGGVGNNIDYTTLSGRQPL